MVLELLDSRAEVEYEGTIDGATQRLRVVLTDVSKETGIAYFQAKGGPY